MKETLEKLWNEYFAEECAQMNTEKEKTPLRRFLSVDGLPTPEREQSGGC